MKLPLINILICFVLNVSCSHEQDIKYYEENGFRSKGRFLNDSIKVGVHYSYYPNGIIRSKAKYDSSGTLNGEAIIYHQNGKLWQTRYFVDNSIEGSVKEYYRNGVIKSKAYFFNNRNVGNVYHYHENGNLSTYNFYDFNGRNLIYISFDTIGKSNKIMGLEQFISDSLIVRDNNKLDSDSAKLFILLAKIPKLYTELHLQELDIQNRILENKKISTSDSMMKIQLRLNDNSSQLKVIGTSYDSTSGRKKTVISHYEIL